MITDGSEPPSPRFQLGGPSSLPTFDAQFPMFKIEVAVFRFSAVDRKL